VETREPDKRDGSQAGRSIRGCSLAIGNLAGDRQHDDGNIQNTDATQLNDVCGGERCSLEPWSSGRRRPGTAVPDVRRGSARLLSAA
jgi:hypothetical protein